jgi:hypothetical protein
MSRIRPTSRCSCLDLRMSGGSSLCLAAPRHSATSYTRFCASDRLVPFRSFSFRTRRAICATSASVRAKACLHQDHTFHCRPHQATSVLHEQFAVPPDFVRGFLLNGLRRPSRAAPMLSPCGSAPSRRAVAPRALSSAPAPSPTASPTPPAVLPPSG